MSNNITFIAKLNNKEFNDSANQAKTQIDGLERAMISANLKATAIAGALKTVFHTAVDIVKDIYKSGVEMQKPWDDLTVSLRGQGKALGDVRKQVEEFTSALGKAKGVDDEALVGVLAELTKGGEDLNSAMKDLNFTMDIAARNNMSLSEAAQLLNKAHEGNVKAIKAMGVSWKESTNDIENARNAQEALARSVVGAHDDMMARDPAKRLAAAWGELKDTLVQGIFPALQEGLANFTETINGLDPSAIQSFAQKAGESFRSLTDQVGMATDTIKQAPSALGAIKEGAQGFADKADDWRDKLKAKAKIGIAGATAGIKDFLGLSSPEDQQKTLGYVAEQQAKIDAIEKRQATAIDNTAPERLYQKYFSGDPAKVVGTSQYMLPRDRIARAAGPAAGQGGQLGTPYISPVLQQQQRDEIAQEWEKGLQEYNDAVHRRQERNRNAAMDEIRQQRAHLQIQSPMRLQVVKVGGMHGSRGSGR